MSTTSSEFFLKEFENGQAQFCDSIKALLFKSNENIFDLLDFGNDEIYLEPMLFAYFNSKNPLESLDQIIFGYVNNEKRPVQIKVYSNEDGIVYLPKIGYFYSNLKKTYLDLRYNHLNNLIELFNGINPVNYAFSPIETLTQIPHIEICLHSNSLLSKYFIEWAGFKDFESLKIKDTAIDQKRLIETSFEILKRSSFDDYGMLTRSTRKIYLFRNPEIRCFVTRAVHGAIFLNVPENSNETFYLEELIHQCSHNVFNAITADIKEYFKVDPSSSLSNFIRRDGEKRSLYDAFHGHYTVCKGIEYLSKCLNNVGFVGDKLYELIGRIAIKEKRFRIGLNLVDFNQVFTQKGATTYGLLDNACERVISSHPFIFNKYNFSNQKAVFDYSRFKDVNPITNDNTN
jgi:hypothetical protein